MGENHPMHNRALHISDTFKESEKANIDEEKANIEEQKANIEGQKANIEIVKANIGDSFTEKTASNICKLLEMFGFQTIFGRADVQNVRPTEVRNVGLLCRNRRGRSKRIFR
jgi:hypothetical protein